MLTGEVSLPGADLLRLEQFLNLPNPVFYSVELHSQPSVPPRMLELSRQTTCQPAQFGQRQMNVLGTSVSRPDLIFKGGIIERQGLEQQLPLFRRQLEAHGLARFEADLLHG